MVHQYLTSISLLEELLPKHVAFSQILLIDVRVMSNFMQLIQPTPDIPPRDSYLNNSQTVSLRPLHSDYNIQSYSLIYHFWRQ